MQKTAYEMRISDWSSDVCSSDLSCRSTTARPACATWSRSTLSAARMPTMPFPRKEKRSPMLLPRVLRLKPPRSIWDSRVSSRRSEDGSAAPPSHPERLSPRDRRHRLQRSRQIGRASCRERVCQYVSITVVAGPYKKKNEEHY